VRSRPGASTSAKRALRVWAALLRQPTRRGQSGAPAACAPHSAGYGPQRFDCACGPDTDPDTDPDPDSDTDSDTDFDTDTDTDTDEIPPDLQPNPDKPERNRG
jgi:hypothetical protein